MTCQIHWSTPQDDAETLLRIRPLREQWEARGPGVLGRLKTILPWLKLPREVTVRLINPVVGGAGRVLSSTEIEFEAVLANPWPMLPEVVRLGWLIACMELGEDKREPIGLMPAVVSAAEYVELARLDETSLTCALQHWCGGAEVGGSEVGGSEVGGSEVGGDVTSSSLLNWWESNKEEVHDLAGWRAALDQF